MSTEPSLTIIGAGLAGSLLAVFLARRGYQVTVYERRADMRRVDVPAGRSINLALADRGIRALAAAGLEQRVTPLLIPMRGRMLHDPSGELSFQPYSQNPSEQIYSVSRSGLNSLLMDAAETHGAELRFQQGCATADFAASTVTIRDETDGRMHTLPMRSVIATDGAGSAVRQAMAELPGHTASDEPLGHSYKELTIPAAENGEHRIEKNALHIWPRGEFMLIALPNLDGSFTVTLFLPNEGERSFAALHTPTAVAGFFEESFADALKLIPDLIEAFFANPTGELGTIRCEPWHVGGDALILGDAAHAVVPFHGQGMNCAFEDCVALDQLLDTVGPDWDRVFADISTSRKPNADAIADMALENYIEMRALVADPRFQLQKKLAFALERRFPERFIPRYSMVMFRGEIPYAEARRRGSVQARIVEELTEGVTDLAAVDFERAEALVAARLAPLG